MRYESAKTAASWWTKRLTILLNHQDKYDIISKNRVESFQILLEKTLNKKLSKGEENINLIWTQGLLKKIKDKLNINSSIGEESFYDLSMIVDSDLVEIYIKDKMDPFVTIYDKLNERSRNF